MKTQTGIWLDFKEANIIRLKSEEVELQNIPSEVETYNLVGGARSKKPWGPMDKTSESKHLARRLQQEKQFYENIMEVVSDSDEIFIMGPAEAKLGLQKVMESHHGLQGKLLSVESADSMTSNQKVARVKAFFQKS